MAKKTGMFHAFGQFFSFISTTMGLLEKSVNGIDKSLDDGVSMMNSTTRNLRKDLEIDFALEEAEREHRRKEMEDKLKAMRKEDDGIHNNNSSI